MKGRHGFTLIEILAALALLSLVVAGCLPFLTAGATPSIAESGMPTAELGRIADELVGPDADPPLELEAIPPAPDSVVIEHVVDDDVFDLRIGRLESNTEEAGHCWVRIAFDSTVVFRWIPVPEPLQGTEDSP